MSRKFRDFMKEIEAEARAEGPEAVAELAAFDAHYRLALEVFELRKARGLTQRQLAARSGLQQAEISRIEAGNSNPTLSTMPSARNSRSCPRRQASLPPSQLRRQGGVLQLWWQPAAGPEK